MHAPQCTHSSSSRMIGCSSTETDAPSCSNARATLAQASAGTSSTISPLVASMFARSTLIATPVARITLAITGSWTAAEMRIIIFMRSPSSSQPIYLDSFVCLSNFIFVKSMSLILSGMKKYLASFSQSPSRIVAISSK